MEISLTPDQEAHIAAFRAALDAAEESIARGQGRPITRESLRDHFADERWPDQVRP